MKKLLLSLLCLLFIFTKGAQNAISANAQTTMLDGTDTASTDIRASYFVTVKDLYRAKQKGDSLAMVVKDTLTAAFATKANKDTLSNFMTIPVANAAIATMQASIATKQKHLVAGRGIGIWADSLVYADSTQIVTWKGLDTAGMANKYLAGTGVSITGTGTTKTISTTGGGFAVFLPNLTVSESSALAIAAGLRTVTVSCTGAQVGDRLLLNETTNQSGFAVITAICTAANTIVVKVQVPLISLTLGAASYSVTCKVTAFR